MPKLVDRPEYTDAQLRAQLADAISDAADEARSAERAARDAADAARHAEHLLKHLKERSGGGLDLGEDRTARNVAALIEVCREIAAPLSVWDERFADDNLERLVGMMREYARRSAAA